MLDALHHVALSLGDTSDPVGLAALGARHARALLRADDVVIYIWDSDAAVLRLAYGENTGHSLLATMAAGEGAIGRAFQTGEPSVVTDYPNWEGALPSLVQRGVKRVAAVPLKIERRAVGVLAVRFLGRRGCEPAHVRTAVAGGAGCRHGGRGACAPAGRGRRSASRGDCRPPAVRRRRGGMHLRASR